MGETGISHQVMKERKPTSGERNCLKTCGRKSLGFRKNKTRCLVKGKDCVVWTGKIGNESGSLL
jgi:hypothetical protein